MEKENNPTLKIDDAPKKRGRPRKYAENEYKIVEKPSEIPKRKIKLPSPTHSDNEEDDNFDEFEEPKQEYEDSEEFKELLEEEENLSNEDVEEKPKIHTKKPLIQTKEEVDDLPEKPHIVVHKKHKGIRPRKIIVITHDSDVDSDDEKLKPAPKIVFKQATKSEPKPKIINQKPLIRKVEIETPKVETKKIQQVVREQPKPKYKVIQSEGVIHGEKINNNVISHHDTEIINNARNNPLNSDPWLMELFGL